MLEKKSKKKIWEELKKNKFEDIQVIKDIEKILIKKRGYVFKIPKPGESVILLLSGGTDSIVMWDVLISEYKLNVYPLFVTKKKGLFRLLDNQYRSVKFFEKFYKNKYKESLNPIFVIPATKFLTKQILDETLKNPKEIIDNIYDDGNINIQAYYATTLLSILALDYSELLRIKENETIQSIFTGNLFNDGFVSKNQTLTSLRSNMLNICGISNNYKRQFTSLFMEKEMGYFFDKNFVIKWAISKNIPINKAWTCWERKSLIPCGVCTTCRYRKKIMHKNNFKDTLYKSDIINRLLTIKAKIYNIFLERKT